MKQIEYKKIPYTVESINPREGKGGQHCGMPHLEIEGYCEILDIRIKAQPHRSQHRNFELVKALMELAIDDTLNL